jgi:replicative DNA helicase
MFLHALIQGGPPAIKRAMKSGIKPEHLGSAATDHYKTYAFLLRHVGSTRSPNEAEIYTATDVEVPDCEWECDVDIYTEAVRKQFLRGELMDGLDKVITKTEGDPDRGRDMLQELFLTTSRGGKKEEVRTNSEDTIKAIRDRYDERKERRLAGKIVGLSTPWNSWSKRSKGYQKGQITTLLAKTGIGKTHIALVQANHTWLNDLVDGECVMFVSLETVRETLLDRIAAIRLKPDYERFTGGRGEAATRLL